MRHFFKGVEITEAQYVALRELGESANVSRIAERAGDKPATQTTNARIVPNALPPIDGQYFSTQWGATALRQFVSDPTEPNMIKGTKAAIRTFDTGATRSPLGDKLQYEGYLSPIVLRRFAQYMKKHQTQSDGNVRPADNWQSGIPKESLMDSKMRHDMDLWLHHRGYSQFAEEDIEEALCAIIFNTMAYLKAVLEAER